MRVQNVTEEVCVVRVTVCGYDNRRGCRTYYRGEGSRLLLFGQQAIWIPSTKMHSGSLSCSTLAFLVPRFVAFLRFNLGTGVLSVGVTGVMETMSWLPAEVERMVPLMWSLDAWSWRPQAQPRGNCPHGYRPHPCREALGRAGEIAPLAARVHGRRWGPWSPVHERPSDRHSRQPWQSLSGSVGIVASGLPADPHCIGSRLSLGTDHSAGWWRTSWWRPLHSPAND